MSAILGIDYGAKRVGVAIARGGLNIAHPLCVLNNSHSLLKELRQLARQEAAELVVLGWPRSLNGQMTEQTRQVEAFRRQLEEAHFKVTVQDEAGTTQVAEQSGGDDAHAAALILQDYLETQNTAKTPKA